MSFLLLVALGVLPAPAPAHSDTIKAQRQDGQALSLRTGTDTSDTFLVRDGQRRLVMTYVEDVTRQGTQYLIVGRNIRPDGTLSSVDSVLVDAATLAPAWHADSSQAGAMTVRFSAGRLVGTRTDSNGVTAPVNELLPAAVFDYSMASRVVNSLPLGIGYSAVIPSYDIRRGPQTTRIIVVGEADVARDGRTVSAWRVQADYGAMQVERLIDKVTRRDLQVTMHARGMEVLVQYRIASAPPGAQAYGSRDDLLLASFHSGAGHVEQVFTTSVERMPESAYGFKPAPEVRSFAELVGHVAESNYVFCAIMLGESAPARPVAWAQASKAEVQKALAESFTYCNGALAAMNGPQGQALVQFQGRKWPAVAVMNFRNYHALLHYGNVITYLRMCGLVPPSTEP